MARRGSTIAISCGGTGGHFYPGLCIAIALKKLGMRPLLCIVSNKQTSSQRRIVSAEDIQTFVLPGLQRPREKWRLPLFGIIFLVVLLRSVWIVRRYRVDLVLAMGSFASFPLGLASVFLRKPLFLHEANTILGEANAIMSRWARLLLLAWPLYQKNVTRAPQKILGMPIRKDILSASRRKFDRSQRTEQCRRLGLKPQLPIVFIWGGSHGSERMNRLMADAVTAKSNASVPFQLIHLTGQMDNTALMKHYAKYDVPAYVRKHSESIADFLTFCDLVVSRAGGSSMAELASFAKATIFIPLSTAKDDHQRWNVEMLLEHGAASMIDERICTGEQLLRCIDHWLRCPEKMKECGDRFRQLSRSNATEAILDLIVQELGMRKDDQS